MYVGEKIRVIAAFGMPYKIKPVRFGWSGRLFEVRNVTYSWKAKEGDNDIYHFSVTDGDSLYELTFDTGSLVWKLENIEV